MYQYAVILLLFLNITLSHECCEEGAATSLLLEAHDLITQAMDIMPICSENQVCVQRNIDCSDLCRNGYKNSGVYNIAPMNRLLYKKQLQVYCDMETDGGGWTVIQRRGNFGKPFDYFNKGWREYKLGFGTVDTDFWLGNDKIFGLTHQQNYSVRFDLEDRQGVRAFAKYDNFWIDDEYNQFRLHISGYSGDAGDGMVDLNEMKFSTKDRDNDLWPDVNCGERWMSGWWFKACYNGYSSLNGVDNATTNGGIDWMPFRWDESLRWTEIKIRPSY